MSTSDKQNMISLVTKVQEEKKKNSDWMVEEYGNSFLESYDSFSVSKTISNHEFDSSHYIQSIEQLYTDERQGEEAVNFNN